MYFCCAISLSSASRLLYFSETGSWPRWTCLNETSCSICIITHDNKHSIESMELQNTKWCIMLIYRPSDVLFMLLLHLVLDLSSEHSLLHPPVLQTAAVTGNVWQSGRISTDTQIRDWICRWEHPTVNLSVPSFTSLMVGLLGSFINNFATPAGLKMSICGSSVASSADV